MYFYKVNVFEDRIELINNSGMSCLEIDASNIIDIKKKDYTITIRTITSDYFWSFKYGKTDSIYQKIIETVKITPREENINNVRNSVEQVDHKNIILDEDFSRYFEEFVNLMDKEHLQIMHDILSIRILKIDDQFFEINDENPPASPEGI